MLNMNWFMEMIKQGYNPQQVMMSILQNQMRGTPVGDNLLRLAQNGDTMGIEKIARNMAIERGLDFDKEFAAFKKRLGF